jgi:hypothetical protein
MMQKSNPAYPTSSTGAEAGIFIKGPNTHSPAASLLRMVSVLVVSGIFAHLDVEALPNNTGPVVLLYKDKAWKLLADSF